MKRSEMVRQIHDLFANATSGSPGTDAIRELVGKSLLSEWEPETPRLLLVAGAVIEETEHYRHTVAAPREAPGRTERNAKILADMFEAYNRAQEGGPEGAPDVITKTRQGRTVHYAVGPIRETREMAERDVRLLKVGVWDGDE